MAENEDRPGGAGKRLSRRQLLKGASALAAGAAVAAARPAEALMRYDGRADVIVVGFGGAGASAAIEAARAGASVLVLERAAAGGGTSAMAGGIIYYGGGTALQKALGYDDSAEEMFKYLMASCGPQADERKVRVFCEHSVEHFDWTVALGVPFKESFYEGISLPLTDDGLLYSGSEKAWPYSEIAKPAPRGHKPRVSGDGGGALLMDKLMAAAVAAGAKVVSDCLCEALIQKADGQVVGVTATIGGVEHNYLAKGGVVLAGGGFCHNREMMERYAPIYLQCDTPIGVAGDDGRAIRMGMRAGGDAIRMDSAFCALPFHPPEKLIDGVLVNRHGQRFLNEDSYYGRTGEVVVRQQDGGATWILDASIDAESKYARAKSLGSADSIAALETKLGLPAPVLQETIDVYNRYAAKGEDPLFHKAAEYLRPLDRPPFRAYDCGTSAAYYPYFTLGGLHTRTSGEVLDVDGQPVPGLFAAGRTTSGVSALGYSSGISLADATFFGRLAGRSAAAGARA